MYKLCRKKFQNHLPKVKCEQFWRVNNFGVKIVHNVNIFDNLIFQPFSNLFIQSIFYLQIHSLFTVLFCLFVLSCFQSCQGGYLFLSCSQSCQGWKIFLVEITSPWTISTSRGKFSYKGLDIKLAQCWLVQHIGLDFLYTARFGVPLTFPCSFLRKIQKTSKNPSNIAPLTVCVSWIIPSDFSW